MRDYLDNAALANDMGRYFHRKIVNIRNDRELNVADVTQDKLGRLIDDPEFKFTGWIETRCGGCAPSYLGVS